MKNAGSKKKAKWVPFPCISGVDLAYVTYAGTGGYNFKTRVVMHTALPRDEHVLNDHLAHRQQMRDDGWYDPLQALLHNKGGPDKWDAKDWDAYHEYRNTNKSIQDAKRTYEKEMDPRARAGPVMPFHPWDNLSAAEPEAGWWPCLALSFPPGAVHAQTSVPFISTGWLKRVVTCWYQALANGQIMGWWVVTCYYFDGTYKQFQYTNDEWGGYLW